MSEQALKVGDTVKPNSGGPLMTVVGVGTNEKGEQVIWTTWFDTNHKENRGHYPAAAVHVDDGTVSFA